MKPDHARRLRREIGKPLLWALATSLVICASAMAGEQWYRDPGHGHVLQRFHPVGGWHPDSGGLWHWWNADCFPGCGGPDDYCRKPPPCVCRPFYPPFYYGQPPRPLTQP